MVFGLFEIVFVVLAGVAASLIWISRRHYVQHRDAAMGYENHSLTPPPSTVCPQCRRRAYGRRAVTEQYCEPCDLHYGRDHRDAA